MGKPIYRVHNRKRGSVQPRVQPAYTLPGVGDGLVDPDFDDVVGGEREAIEGVMGHGRTEDYD